MFTLLFQQFAEELAVSDEAEREFINHDWDEDKEWQEYVRNVTLPVGREEESLYRVKRKWFRKNKNENLEVVDNNVLRPEEQAEEYDMQDEAMASAILLALLSMDIAMAEQAQAEQSLVYTPRALPGLGGEEQLEPEPIDALNFNLDQFAREIEKAIELSFKELEALEQSSGNTSIDEDLSRAVGLSLASARRSGLEVSSDAAVERKITSILDEKLTAATPRGPRTEKPPVPKFGSDADAAKVDTDLLDKAVEASLESALKKMDASEDPEKMRAALDTKVKKTVKDLRSIFAEKEATPRVSAAESMPPPTPGRAAIKTGGVKAMLEKFKEDA